MATVIAKVKVMPTSPEVDKESLKATLKELVENNDAKCRGVSDEPLAFGLYTVFVMVEMEEKEGGMDPIEEAMNALENVESAEVVELSLV
ncbi:elongation factor 1-beta [Methanococcus maripaludis]|uniref:Elongation factor 1-beta n=2 Tax=Methanococcus maripaludis TaxID=39152 RepID=EF1B_METM7|nr:elongation factor 1-beta [Methanococcus maripaludis]A6VGY7.1 RecName: Full=Elongation factor 1-beta; Short=EF-1-beta; AltName: Full=aEF-1beta [Methanococcus maripaludis C7]MBA2839816.1 elongation factor 1-beta [Methanococcus maripaludis]MBA2852393.1 elongation factor 1-beta [Methanococcus maripaludis]MBA2859534.1 elongation factor 1-beta [Methanococcus maripaludis]MBA2861367.1 elongation factor 1-beta [Methanococcus maripaludis]MBA2868171.1 elongation factor 1-beta [Methanococcus maripalud